MLRRIWITRTRPGAEQTAARLSACGFAPVVQPLLEARPLPAPSPDLGDVAALAFTSASGVAAFAALGFKAAGAHDIPVFCVGDATAAAAAVQGFHAVLSADGDLRALARRLNEAGLRGVVLHPGASEPAGDLAALTAPGVAVRALALYETVACAPPQPPCDAVLFHSPRAARAFAAAAYASDGRVAVAISRAAAQPVEALGWTDLRIAAAPRDDALIAALGKPPARV